MKIEEIGKVREITKEVINYLMNTYNVDDKDLDYIEDKIREAYEIGYKLGYGVGREEK